MGKLPCLQGAQRLFTNATFLLALYGALGVGAALGQYLKTAARPGDEFTRYNNYLILKSSFQHLVDHHNLYAWHLKDHWDLYKYSPTFAVLFAPFALLPDWFGLIVWNAINALLLFFAIRSMPFLQLSVKASVLLFSSLELLISLQDLQTNGVMASLMIFSFSFLLRNKILLATFCVVLSAFVKIFGVFTFLLFLVFPNNVKAFLLALMWVVVLAALPLFFISPSQLLLQYFNWLDLLQYDHTISEGMSIIGWLKSWFGIESSKALIQIIGVLLLCFPLIKTHLYKNFLFRIWMLSSILIWVVIFNHKAESATFIIAVCGCALWYYTSRKTFLDTLLIIAVFILTCLSPTDLCPKLLRKAFIKPYALEAVPVILTWAKLSYDLLSSAKLGSAVYGEHFAVRQL